MKLKHLYCVIVVAAMALLGSVKSFAQAYTGRYVAEWGVNENGAEECTGAAKRFVITSSYIKIGARTIYLDDVRQSAMDIPYDEINVSKCSSYELCSHDTNDYGMMVPFNFELSQHPVSTVKGEYYLFKIPYLSEIMLLKKEGGQKSASPKTAKTGKTTKRKASRRR